MYHLAILTVPVNLFLSQFFLKKLHGDICNLDFFAKFRSYKDYSAKLCDNIE